MAFAFPIQGKKGGFGNTEASYDHGFYRGKVYILSESITDGNDQKRNGLKQATGSHDVYKGQSRDARVKG